MIRDLFRAALAAVVLWPAFDRPAPVPVQPAPVQAAPVPVPVPYPVPLAIPATGHYNPTPSRLRATVAAALDRLDKWVPF